MCYSLFELMIGVLIDDLVEQRILSLSKWIKLTNITNLITNHRLWWITNNDILNKFLNGLIITYIFLYYYLEEWWFFTDINAIYFKMWKIGWKFFNLPYYAQICKIQLSPTNYAIKQPSIFLTPIELTNQLKI